MTFKNQLPAKQLIPFRIGSADKFGEDFEVRLLDLYWSV